MRRTDADIEYGYCLDNEKQLLEVGEVGSFGSLKFFCNQ